MTASHVAARRRRFAPRQHGKNEQIRLNTHTPPFSPVDAAVLAGSMDRYMRALGELAREVEQEQAS